MRPPTSARSHTPHGATVARPLILGALVGAASLLLGGCLADPAPIPRSAIDAAILPMIARHQVPGVAVAVVRGEDTALACYGVASREDPGPVTDATLFEIGSISKTFTALLGASVVERGLADLDDPLSRHLPGLSGTPLGRATLLQAATYSAGGLPLQVPAETRPEDAEEYLARWVPEFEPGARRAYSNPSIAVFGLAVAHAAGAPFEEAMARDILAPLGLTDTFLEVPPTATALYAQGYTSDGRPVRLTPGVLGAPAYGVRTTVRDMAAYLRAQLRPRSAGSLAGAIARTQLGRYSVGPMTQGLGWEMYPYPTPLADLLNGNGPAVVFEANAVEPLRELGPEVLYNKTGSTNGFAAYAVFVPARGLGVAILANRSLPIPDRVRAVYEILRALDPGLASTPTAGPP